MRRRKRQADTSANALSELVDYWADDSWADASTLPGLDDEGLEKLDADLARVGLLPPDGWYVLGTLVDKVGPVEFSKEVGEDGPPLWERHALPKNSENKQDVTPPRVELLNEAAGLITGDRNRTYGSPTENFKNTADLWNVQFAHLFKEGAGFRPADIAQAQILLKMARMIKQPKRDNYLDVAGYAACGWECEEPDNGWA